jgi:flagellar L-ring protein precursor FlgH
MTRSTPFTPVHRPARTGPATSRRAVSALALVLVGAAHAQSLFEQPVEPPIDRVVPSSQPPKPAGASPALSEVSLYAVEPPKPKEYQENDLVQIIISERSQIDREQEAESQKDYDNDLTVSNFLDIVNLLETRIQQTSDERLPKIGVNAAQDFSGSGEYTRSDRITDRVMARVLEVKPNGVLLLEARRKFVSDEEETVVLLSGSCRGEDITVNNSVQSNQIFDLSLNVQNTGDLKRTSRKGLIPRLLESLLNF